MLQSPCGLLGCPTILGLPSIFETFKREKFDHARLVKYISDSHQAFRSTEHSNIIHSDNICCIVPNGGTKPKKLGVQLHPYSNV